VPKMAGSIRDSSVDEDDIKKAVYVSIVCCSNGGG